MSASHEEILAAWTAEHGGEDGLLAGLRREPALLAGLRHELAIDALLHLAHARPDGDLAERVMCGLPTRSRRLRIADRVMDRLPGRQPSRLPRLRLLAAAALVLLLGAAAWIARAGTAPPAPVARIVAAGPDAVVRRDGASRPAVAGAGLHAGDLLVAGGQEVATIELLAPDGSGAGRLHCLHGATLDMPRPSSQGALGLLAGTLRAEIPPRPPGEPLVIATPAAEAVILGTVFDLRADADGTLLGVLSGSVRLQRDGRELVVAAGETAQADPDRFAVLAPRDLLPDATAGLPGARGGDWRIVGAGAERRLVQADAAAPQAAIDLLPIARGESVLITGRMRLLAVPGTDGDALGLCIGNERWLASAAWLHHLDRDPAQYPTPWIAFRVLVRRGGDGSLLAEWHSWRQDRPMQPLLHLTHRPQPRPDAYRFGVLATRAPVELADLQVRSLAP